jgi:hypothetical protein
MLEHRDSYRPIKLKWAANARDRPKYHAVCIASACKVLAALCTDLCRCQENGGESQDAELHGDFAELKRTTRVSYTLFLLFIKLSLSVASLLNFAFGTFGPVLRTASISCSAQTLSAQQAPEDPPSALRLLDW